MRKFLKEAGNKTGSRRTEISYKADHPGASQPHMTTPCDSGDTGNEAVFKESISPYPGRSDRHGGPMMRCDAIPVAIADGATGPRSPGAFVRIPGASVRDEIMGNHIQEYDLC